MGWCPSVCNVRPNLMLLENVGNVSLVLVQNPQTPREKLTEQHPYFNHISSTTHSSYADMKLQVIVAPPCDRALIQSLHILPDFGQESMEIVL